MLRLTIEHEAYGVALVVVNRVKRRGLQLNFLSTWLNNSLSSQGSVGILGVVEKSHDEHCSWEGLAHCVVHSVIRSSPPIHQETRTRTDQVLGLSRLRRRSPV